ncbi:hypothetical protein V8C86DRAFT_3033839 [Haematococcus lacustris]
MPPTQVYLLCLSRRPGLPPGQPAPSAAAAQAQPSLRAARRCCPATSPRWGAGREARGLEAGGAGGQGGGVIWSVAGSRWARDQLLPSFPPPSEGAGAISHCWWACLDQGMLYLTPASSRGGQGEGGRGRRGSPAGSATGPPLAPVAGRGGRGPQGSSLAPAVSPQQQQQQERSLPQPPLPPPPLPLLLPPCGVGAGAGAGGGSVVVEGLYGEQHFFFWADQGPAKEQWPALFPGSRS